MNPAVGKHAGLSPTAIPSVLGRYLLFGKLVYEGKMDCLLLTLNLKHNAKKQRNDLSSPSHFWIFRKTGNHCYSVLHTSPCTSHHTFLSLASAPLPFMTVSLVPFELCKYHPILLFTSACFAPVSWFTSILAGHRVHQCYGTAVLGSCLHR